MDLFLKLDHLHIRQILLSHLDANVLQLVADIIEWAVWYGRRSAAGGMML